MGPKVEVAGSTPARPATMGGSSIEERGLLKLIHALKRAGVQQLGGITRPGGRPSPRASPFLGVLPACQVIDLHRYWQDPTARGLPGADMRIAHVHTAKRVIRFIAVAAGAATVAALALPSVASGASSNYSASQLSAVSGVVDQSGVAGIAWYVDAQSHRVVITAD